MATTTTRTQGLRLHQGREVQKQELKEILDRLIKQIREDASLDGDDPIELKRAWENYEFPLLRNPFPEAEEVQKVEEILQFYIEPEELKFEFYSKFFILYPGFRKYLAANPAVLQKLLSNSEARTFIKCVGFFLGLRYLDDMRMNDADTFLYNTLLAVFDGLTADLEFEQEALPTLEAPFNAYPLPRPDLINFYKSRKIQDLVKSIQKLEEENSAITAERDRLKKSLHKPAAASAPLPSSSTPAPTASLPTPITQTEVPRGRDFSAEVGGRASLASSASSYGREPRTPEPSSRTLDRGQAPSPTSALPPALIPESPSRASNEFRSSFARNPNTFLTEENPKVTKFDRAELGSPFVITVTLLGKTSGVIRNIQVNFDSRSFIVDRTDFSRNVYTSFFNPTAIGRFVVTSVEIDGEVIPDSTFTFEVHRDYKAITAPSREVKYPGMRDPWGLALFENQLFISDPNKEVKKIFQFDADLNFRREFATPVVNNENAFPRGIAVTPDNILVVVCADIGKIQTFSLEQNGKLLLQFGGGIQAGRSLEDGKFKLPRGVCIGFKDDIVIVDSDQHRIQVYSQQGQFIRTFGKYGKSTTNQPANPGDFFYPASVAYQPLADRKVPGRLVVTDCDNSRIQILSWEGAPIKVINNQHLLRPSGVVVDPVGNIIVSDLQANSLFIFDPEGNTLIHKISGLNGPRMVATDNKGRIFVADMGNSRVVQY